MAEEIVVGKDGVTRPVYPTRHEQMLAWEREYAMEMRDQVESLARRLDVFTRLSWVKRSSRHQSK